MMHRKTAVRRRPSSSTSSPGPARPSPRVRELIRRGAALVLEAPPEWIAEVDRATLAVEPAIAEDPVLAAATRRTNRENLLHWAAANVRDPGSPVAANVGPEPLGIARDLVRRGLGVSALASYRAGQNAAWLRWMQIAFDLTQDPAELRELLDVTARSISTFVDATAAAIAKQMEIERAHLTRGTQAERREVVALLLEGAPISAASAGHRLAYSLDPVHRAAIVWSEAPSTDRAVLDGAAEALARELGAARPLIVVASEAALWVWIASAAEANLARLTAELRKTPDVRLAIGSKGPGVEGFRRAHLDALTAQSIMSRLGVEPRVASFEMLELVALVTADVEAADRFVAATLGDLASAPEELQRTVRTYLEEGCNSSRAAPRLRTHRNTLVRRLARADELLPRPLSENVTRVGVALEIVRWRA